MGYISFLKQIQWKHRLFYSFFFPFTFFLDIVWCRCLNTVEVRKKEEIHFQPKPSVSAIRTFNWNENETISCKLDFFLLRVKSNHHKMAPQLLRRLLFFFFNHATLQWRHWLSYRSLEYSWTDCGLEPCLIK